MTVDDPKTF